MIMDAMASRPAATQTRSTKYVNHRERWKQTFSSGTGTGTAIFLRLRSLQSDETASLKLDESENNPDNFRWA
jgi:hypothetical protein